MLRGTAAKRWQPNPVGYLCHNKTDTDPYTNLKLGDRQGKPQYKGERKQENNFTINNVTSHFLLFQIKLQNPNAHQNIIQGVNRKNGPDFGRVFLMLNYTENPQNTYIQTWTVSEIMASEVWNFDTCYTLTDYQIHIETGRNMWFL